MLIEGVGNYVALIAEGPGDPLWYSTESLWTSDPDSKKVFTGVQRAIRTPILGLPPGYRARLTCVEIDVDRQPQSRSWCC
jgi:hypothetical protein